MVSDTTGSRKQDPLIGTLINERYRIQEVLGRGGMGVVYKARHELLERTVAVKMLLPQLVADEGAAARFEREAKASSRLQHPNIIALHDYGRTADGVPYIIMDYIEGESLSDLLKREKQLGTSRSANIFQQVCDALAHAHELGIIHRDLKPGNIMLVQTDEARDFVKVVDFGIAKMYESDGDDHAGQKLTTTGELFGSPVYMSPEQCGGYELDPRSDVYSLGCVMYETLTAKLPCVGRTVLETISKQLNAVPPAFSDARPDLYIPEWMEQIVMRALQKEPDKRQKDMIQLRQEIQSGQSSMSQTKMRAIQVNSTSSMQIRAVSGGVRTVGRAASAASRQNQTSKEWNLYLLITVAVVFLFGGAMLAWSMMPHVPKENPDAPPLRDTHTVTTTQTTTSQEKPSTKPTRENKPTAPHTKKPPAHADSTAVHVATPHTATPPREHPRSHTTSESSKPSPDAVPAAHQKYKSYRKHKQDFYDYAGEHEGETGDPTPLPVKEWSPN